MAGARRMIRNRVRKINPPEPCGGRKPASKITDRALGYRANTKECRPEGPKRCAFCGSRRTVEVGHIDGNETNTEPRNLVWNCRSCNQKIAAAMKKAGKGRRTKQYNGPTRRRLGAYSYRDFAQALAIIDGSAIGNLDQAIALIHDTPMRRRSQFQKDIWVIRKERYGPSGRKDGGAVPF